MWTVLKSHGFYAGDVRITVGGYPVDSEKLAGRIEAMAGDAPVTVTIVVVQGPQFTVGRFEIQDAETGQAELGVEIDRTSLGIDLGDPARAASVIRAENTLIEQMRRQGHLFAAVPDRLVIVDHATRKMEVTLLADPGPYAVFGELAIEGLERMDGGFVRKRSDIRPGAPYSPEAVRSARDNLDDLGVFSRVRVETADELGADGRLPVTLTVTERPRRVIGVGADYSSSEGFGGRVRWGHRNLFGRAESVHLQGEVGRIGRNDVEDTDYDVNLRYEAPDFLSRNQTLRAELSAGRENPDAYRRNAAEAYLGIDRTLTDTLRVSAGIKAERSKVDDFEMSEPLFFASLPASLRFDATDDLLNPTRGYRVDFQLMPYLGDRAFLRTALAASTFYDLRDDGELVLAARARVGSIFGEELLNLPNDKRFFAGGGGSVRGYAFQAIGPRTFAGTPVGGRSLFELGLETRTRVTDTIGIVPFVEGGQVFAEEFPSFKETLQFGAGLGLRYFTPIGPVRFDAAFPLDKREGDDDYQFYVSIGQAF
jgi:translocation and assembly module TamA